MWVTEAGDAGGGGYTWASTYLEVPRTLNELGENDALPAMSAVTAEGSIEVAPGGCTFIIL